MREKDYDRCGRCRADLKLAPSIMSIFNTDTLCVGCKDIEEKHPDYEFARKVEADEVLRGNYNFQGIGWPR